MLKRTVDMVGVLFGLVLLSPVLVSVALAIKLTSPGPVFYRGVRIGRGGRPFRMFKFRTMVMNADRLGGTSTADDDPRVTRVGGWLRAYKIDELPQLLNVLAGTMSLVGPRPQVRWAVERYTPEERLLLTVRPGMTDYASVKFSNEGELLRGAEDADKLYLERIAPTKMRLGLEYVRRQSFVEDLKIIAATMVVALGRPAPASLLRGVLPNDGKE